jgi:hypothetical protein
MGVATTNYVDTMCALRERLLGKPAANGYVLSSTIAGARLWIAPGGTPGSTVAALPAPTTVGKTAYVSDGAAGLAWGATVTGGGSTHYLVWSNGANWTVVGK